MNELEDIYGEVVEGYALDGANTFTLMKNKHEGNTPE